MEIIGKVHLIGQTEEVGSNGFTKRQIVIATDEQYSQTVPIDFVKDKTSILDNYKIGDDVKVSVNVRGNEYNGRYYVNLQGWRVERNQNATQQTAPTPSPANEPETDLPF